MRLSRLRSSYPCSGDSCRRPRTANSSTTPFVPFRHVPLSARYIGLMYRVDISDPRSSPAVRQLDTRPQAPRWTTDVLEVLDVLDVLTREVKLSGSEGVP